MSALPNRIDIKLTIGPRTADPSPEEGPADRRCAHCGCRMPADIGEWSVGIGMDGQPGIVCSRDCSRGEDFPP